MSAVHPTTAFRLLTAAALQAGVESDTAVQNSLMRLAQRQGQTPAQLEAYIARLQKLGLQPDQQTFNVLIRACAAHSQLDQASGILDRMSAAGVSLCSLPSTCNGFWAAWSLVSAGCITVPACLSDFLPACWSVCVHLSVCLSVSGTVITG